MSLVLIIATPTEPRRRLEVSGLSPALATREAGRLRAVINRWRYPEWTIRDDNGDAIATVDLRKLVGVECAPTDFLSVSHACGKSAAANDG